MTTADIKVGDYFFVKDWTVSEYPRQVTSISDPRKLFYDVIGPDGRREPNTMYRDQIDKCLRKGQWVLAEIGYPEGI